MQTTAVFFLLPLSFHSCLLPSLASPAWAARLTAPRAMAAKMIIRVKEIVSNTYVDAKVDVYVD